MPSSLRPSKDTDPKERLSLYNSLCSFEMNNTHTHTHTHSHTHTHTQTHFPCPGLLRSSSNTKHPVQCQVQLNSLVWNKSPAPRQHYLQRSIAFVIASVNSKCYGHNDDRNACNTRVEQRLRPEHSHKRTKRLNFTMVEGNNRPWLRIIIIIL